MFDTAKATARKFGTRSSFALNAAVVAFVAVAYLGVHTGHVHADVQFDGLCIGGGTAEHAAREQQLAMLSAALPTSVVTPPTVSMQAAAPIPAHKPRLPQ